MRTGQWDVVIPKSRYLAEEEAKRKAAESAEDEEDDVFYDTEDDQEDDQDDSSDTVSLELVFKRFRNGLCLGLAPVFQPPPSVDDRGP
uniref:Uncharacterized protein n=1 Tax=Timema shepardi TaxID=629360 RepID=A0A7R9G552_TIMSH|nr:unnamed protein product [Timema shepardi]